MAGSRSHGAVTFTWRALTRTHARTHAAAASARGVAVPTVGPALAAFDLTERFLCGAKPVSLSG